MGINNAKWLRGGLGDILLKVGNIKEEEFYVVFSHLKQSYDLVKQYTNNCTYVEMKGLIGSVPNEVPSDCYYPPMEIPEASFKRAREIVACDKTVIGIHPIGSKPSREFDLRTGRPQKLMPIEFIEKVVEELAGLDRQILIFCAPEEKDMFEVPGVTFVSESYIWDCIAVVSKCDVVLAVDSAIKTFSAVQKIPTVVVMGNYEDKVRNKFIDPYKEIIPIKFDNINDIADLAIGKVREILGENS